MELASTSRSESLRTPRRGSSRYSDKLTPEFDPSTYSAGQSLASILNNPHVAKSGDWSTWLFSSDPSLDGASAASPLPSRTAPDLSAMDFQAYVGSISEPYSRFVDVNQHLILEEESRPSSSSEAAGGGGLAACLREIPGLFFDEDFALEKGSTFQAACPFSSIPHNVMLQEKLSQYLDVVEVHLVREISARSDSFFEAQKQIEELNSKMVEACEKMRGLKSTVALLENDLIDSADRVHSLSCQRDNVLALHDKLKLVNYVNQAVSALRILVASGDCGGALDVIDELQQLLEGDELAGMHCFRHLGDQLASSTEAVNNMLAADFVRIAILDSKDLDSSAILSSLNMKDKLYSISTEVKVNEDEESELREQLVPLVIGLLRTSKLPAVLKVYKDTVTTDIKSAIKTVVAESLPVLLAGDSAFTDKQTDSDVSGMSLANKLRSLPAEGFVQLLVAVFKIVQVRLVRAAKLRHLVEQIVSGLQGTYAAEAVAAAFASGAAAVAAAEAAQEQLSQESLPVLAQSVTNSDRGNKGAQLSNISKQFRADVLRENTEALWAACDAAHGRWGKLLGVRAPVHPKLRLQEFVRIHDVTQEFISATEKVGGRLGYNIRGTLQSQSKSFVDSQHVVRVSKITAVLDQESWVPVDVPDEFQSIVDKIILMEDSIDGLNDADEAEEASSLNTSVENGGTTGENHTSDKNPSAENPTELKPENPEKTKAEKTEKKTKPIRIRETPFYIVNSGLILLKMISEYVDISNALPVLATEVVHRVAEIMKVFNSRSCQLVLGAGALQVSGLKSISAKNLALASQTIMFFHVLIPEMTKVLSVYVPDSRRGLLLNELDRVAQDYRVHKEEIYTKLVQIMKERIVQHVSKILPQIVEGWNKSGDGGGYGDGEPSFFAITVTKEVGFLHKVLIAFLLDKDRRSIMTRVAQMLHALLTETFLSVEASTPQANKGIYRDVNHILDCIRGLPLESELENGALDFQPRSLDSFLAQRFGNQAPGF